jgi:hypothetical protein
VAGSRLRSWMVARKHGARWVMGNMWRNSADLLLDEVRKLYRGRVVIGHGLEIF